MKIYIVYSNFKNKDLIKDEIISKKLIFTIILNMIFKEKSKKNRIFYNTHSYI